MSQDHNKSTGIRSDWRDAPLGCDDDGVRELLAVHKACLCLQQLLPPEELARQLIDVLENALDYEYGAVLLLDRPTGDLIPFALSDQGFDASFGDADKAFVKSKNVCMSRGITGWVAEHGTSVRSGNVGEDPRYYGIRHGISSELCVPMLSAGRLLGVVNVETTDRNAYSESDQRVLEILASQMGTAIENSRLHETAIDLQRRETIGKFAGAVAHDFNNLLTVIGGSTELLLGSARDSFETKRLEAIAHAADRASDLCRRLLIFNREHPYRPRVILLSEFLKSFSLLLPDLLGDSVQFSVQFADEPLHIHADTTQLEQVLLNLAVNARDAMPVGGVLSIWAELVPDPHPGGTRDNSSVALVVHDSGNGISAEAQTQIFEPFFSSKQDGAGLGLAITRSIVERHGGTIRLDSTVGEGSTFRVFLPLVEAPTEEAANVVRRPQVDDSRGETVLVVEDDEAVREFVATVLDRANYRVLAAGSGAEALEQSNQHTGPIDLLLTDVVMPAMNGGELAERLRASRPDTRVLFMTGYARGVFDQMETQPDSEAVLAKPFTGRSLARAMRGILDSAPGG